MERTDCLALLRRAPTVQVAGSLDGRTVLRTFHHTVIDGWLAIHGGPKGEKLGLLGQPVVFGADEPLATLPSYWFHAHRACPATTWFRSVQGEGVLEEVHDPAFRAAVLQRLMEELQPEGGHTPVDATDPMYTRVVQGLMVGRIKLDRLRGRDKRGQGKPPHIIQRVLRGLWERGGPGDLAALESIRSVHPDVEVPWLEGGDATFFVHGDGDDALDCGRALADAYWNVGNSPERMARAHRNSEAWVFARSEGELVATARACGDGAKGAWIYDVWVRPDRRGTGLGTELMHLLMDHPALARVRRLHLSTKDADGFYLKLGFGWSHEVCKTPWERKFLSLDRLAKKEPLYASPA